MVWRSGCETEAKDEALIKCFSLGVLDMKEKEGKDRVAFILANRFYSSICSRIIHLLSKPLIRNLVKGHFSTLFIMLSDLFCLLFCSFSA